MISLAMIRIMEKWREYPKFRLLLQVRNVHKECLWTRVTCMYQVGDQLIFQVAQQDCAQVVKLIESEVYDILPLPQSVPIQVRIGVGNNWLEATKRSLS
jgi:DNA polymerase I-like protein with 3'-5' exonuclease and polymerase domains